MPDERIEQLFISHDAEQDRLLLRVITSRTELGAWLTRRVLRELWPPLVASLGTSSAVPAGLTAQAREAVVAFQHEQSVARSTFVTGYRPSGAKQAFGGQALLVTRIDVDTAVAAPEQAVALRIQAAGAHEVTLRLGPTLAHGLCKLLADGARRAHWDLDLRVGRDLSQAPGNGAPVN